MSPQYLAGNMHKLLKGECLEDFETQERITGPDIVREEESEFRGEKLLIYQGSGRRVGVLAQNIEEAVKKCSPEA